jgi:tripartite-type tricarboxylate transporter receptor subunit TctC
MAGTIHRRSVLTGAAALALPAAWAQSADYPARPVRIIVAFTAGGTTDILARAVSQKLTERFKQNFLIDNKPGGGGNIVNSVGPMAVNPSLYKKLNINPLVDLVPVVQIADVPNVLVVHPSLPATTMDEFIAYAKSKPGQLNYGSTGVGTSSHLSGYMLSKRAGLVTTHVPYRGADALNDLLAGRLQFMFATIPSVIQHIQAGKLRAIAVSSSKRSRSLPDVATVAESGFPGFEAGSWFGFFTPKGTPDAVVAVLNKAVNEALPALEAQMVREGADPVGGPPEQFGQFVQREYEKWKVVVRESGATAE